MHSLISNAVELQTSSRATDASEAGAWLLQMVLDTYDDWLWLHPYSSQRTHLHPRVVAAEG